MGFEYFFLLGRIIYGGFFVMMALNHFTKTEMLTQYALSKKVPFARFAVWISGLFILLGGLGMILGLYPVFAAFLIIAFLVLVSFQMHAFWAIQDPQQKQMELINFTKNMALAGAALMTLMIARPWMFAVSLG